jgi:hypothetical protein
VSVRFGYVLGVTRRDIGLIKDIAKLAFAAAAAALVTAIVRTQILSAKPLIILAVCGSLFTVAYVVIVLLLRIPSVEEKRVVLERLMPILPAFLRLKRTPS